MTTLYRRVVDASALADMRRQLDALRAAKNSRQTLAASERMRVAARRLIRYVAVLNAP